jgi:hypothetical protein
MSRTKHMKFLKPAKCRAFCLNAEPSSLIGNVTCPHAASTEARESHASILVCVGFSPNEIYLEENKNATN